MYNGNVLHPFSISDHCHRHVINKRCLWCRKKSDPTNHAAELKCRNLLRDYEIKWEQKIIERNNAGCFYRFRNNKLSCRRGLYALSDGKGAWSRCERRRIANCYVNFNPIEYLVNWLKGSAVFSATDHNKRAQVTRYIISNEAVWWRGSGYSVAILFKFKFRRQQNYCACKLYADDLKLYTVLHADEDCCKLQDKLNALFDWSHDWQCYELDCFLKPVDFTTSQSLTLWIYACHDRPLQRLIDEVCICTHEHWIKIRHIICISLFNTLNND